MVDYSFLKNTRTSLRWEKFGMKRRSGVAIPLFSVRSRKSIGIGEIPDIKLIVQWCEQTGNSIIQLLPLNDTGFDFAPYNSVSSFALDPMYLSVQSLKDVNLNPFKKDIRELRSKYDGHRDKVDYVVKQAKIDLLWKIFKRTYLRGNNKYSNFAVENAYWLEDYSLFRALKHKYGGLSWEEFPEIYRDRNTDAVEEFRKENELKIEFHSWMQWQLFEQLKKVKRYAEEKKIFLMGDIPFLVSRDSSDVWADRKYFNLNKSSGAPPDVYFANGQRWGMPPYERAELENSDYAYFRNKLRYASNFYDMYRIDHFVGFFRVWTVDMSEPEETGGLNGNFDPPDESIWEVTGKKLLDAMLDGSGMLPCAEDLGTVPACSGKVLWEYGVPGMDVQRWRKIDNEFVRNYDYRWLSMSTVSTHDSSSMVEWWHSEAGTVDGILFKRLCSNKGISAENIESVIGRLFDSEHSYYNRLLWKNGISIEDILSALGKNADECGDVLLLYRESFGEKEKFLSLLGIEDESERELLLKGKSNLNFIRRNLGFISNSASIFNILLLQEWLCLDENFLRKIEEKSYRINFPGVVNDANWTVVLPYNLEKILNLDVNGEISGLVLKSGRV